MSKVLLILNNPKINQISKIELYKRLKYFQDIKVFVLAHYNDLVARDLMFTHKTVTVLFYSTRLPDNIEKISEKYLCSNYFVIFPSSKFYMLKLLEQPIENTEYVVELGGKIEKIGVNFIMDLKKTHKNIKSLKKGKLLCF